PDWMQATIRDLKYAVPLQRMGNESEVSAAVCFLLSPAAAFVNGATLRVDGGAPNAKLNWPMPRHDRAPSWDGFHLAVTPKVLQQDK
ncbi:MAG: SDR family oxidoreductase, partial [Ferrovibrionaceae bacterium]